MPAWARLATKIAAGLAVVVLIVGGGLWVALQQSGTAVEGRSANKQEIDRNRQRIDNNSEKINGTLRCLQRARDPQACIDRVAGPQGPGGASGSTGRMGRRGATGRAGLSVRGPRGPRGLRGSPGRNGRDGKDAEPGRDGKDGVDGINGTQGLRGLPGPGPTDEQVQAAINNYCTANNGCRQEPFPDSPPEPVVP